MYEEYYLVFRINRGRVPDNSHEKQIPYPTGTSEVHATGNVYVYGAKDESTVKVHADQDLDVSGTGSGSTLEVHAKHDVRVHGSSGIKLKVDVYARNVYPTIDGQSSRVTKTMDQYVVLKPKPSSWWHWWSQVNVLQIPLIGTVNKHVHSQQDCETGFESF